MNRLDQDAVLGRVKEELTPFLETVPLAADEVQFIASAFRLAGEKESIGWQAAALMQVVAAAHQWADNPDELNHFSHIRDGAWLFLHAIGRDDLYAYDAAGEKANQEIRRIAGNKDGTLPLVLRMLLAVIAAAERGDAPSGVRLGLAVAKIEARLTARDRQRGQKVIDSASKGGRQKQIKAMGLHAKYRAEFEQLVSQGVKREAAYKKVAAIFGGISDRTVRRAVSRKIP